MTRLVVCLTVGAGALSAVLSTLEYNRAMRMVEVSTSQQMVMVTRNLQDVLRSLLPDAGDAALNNALQIFRQDPRITAVRLHAPGGQSVTSGNWPDGVDQLGVWTLSDGGAQTQGSMRLDQPTLLVTSFVEAGDPHTIQMIIDGPYIQSRMSGQVMQQMGNLGIVLGVMLLAALLLLRRWLIAPLWRIVGMTQRNAPPAMFEQTAAEMSGEFTELSGSIARMLRRIEETSDQLRQREAAYQNLYQFAPAPMVSVGPDGRIVRANRRAAELIGVGHEDELVGREILDIIVPKDRGLFRQAIDRLDVEPTHGCEMKVIGGEGERDVAFEFTAVHNEQATLTNVRLSMTDITESRNLMNQVAEQRRLLDLVVNHMSDAIVLVGADGRIITGNQRLLTLVRRNVEELAGLPYEPGEFWARLDLTHPDVFDTRIREAIQQEQQSWSEQFDCRDGAFRFQVIPVLDELHNPIGHLCVVAEVTAQVRNQRLLDQQSAQLRALQQISRRLHMVEDVDELLERAVGELFDVFDTEAVGIALRHADPTQRCRQMLWLGEDRVPWPEGAEVADGVAEALMPRVLPSKSTSFWTDLEQQDEWVAPFVANGLEAIAATALYNKEQTQGILWIARRGGEPIERHHLFLLEALAPLLSTALENAHLRQSLRQLQMTDAVTGLPSGRLLNTLIARQINRPGTPWSLMLIDLDDFRTINERCGIPAADGALFAVADALRANCRASDHIIRYEKDQFVVISPGMEVHETDAKAQRLADLIEAVEVTADDGEKITLRCSIGIAGSAGDHTSGALTIDVAQERVKAAKADPSRSIVSAA